MPQNMMDFLEERKKTSEQKIADLHEAIEQELMKLWKTDTPEASVSLVPHICIFACGSMGRKELLDVSDLDLFFIVESIPADTSPTDSRDQDIDRSDREREIGNLDKYRFFAQIYEVTYKMGYKMPSKNGFYWDFIPESNLLDIGSRVEDFNNSFTARMLLLLESKPLYNDNLYMKLLEKVVQRYFVDYSEHKSDFSPLFLANDIKKYWYTLTLNYEYRRDPMDDINKRHWKRLKLKYSRKLTCYSLLACLYKKDITPEYVIECAKLTPLERLKGILDFCPNASDEFYKIIGEYEWFLRLRDKSPNWWEGKGNKEEAEKHSLIFNQHIKLFEKQLAEYNPSFNERMDL